jgi:hypothetical protein
VLQGVDLRRRSDGGYGVTLTCVICGAAVGPLDYCAFTPPAPWGVESGLLCHRRCSDGKIRQLAGSGHIAMLRLDELARQLVAAWAKRRTPRFRRL